jgi:hypothetical protein
VSEQSPFAAFIDESGSDRTQDPGTYILSAAIIESGAFDEIRDAMRALKLKGQKKLHWRDEDDKRQLLITETIGALPIEHLIVVRDNAEGDRDERRRRTCMKRLTYELEQLGVGPMTLESRGSADDKRDRDVLDSFRATGSISPSLRMDHIAGPAEPILWVPDAVCGAVVRDRIGDPQHWNLIEAKCTVHVCV